MVRQVRDPEFYEVTCNLPRELNDAQIDRLIEYRTIPRLEVQARETKNYNSKKIKKKCGDGKF